MEHSNPYENLDHHKDVVHDVPFVANPGKRCVPANVAMALRYCLPEAHFSWDKIEELSGFCEGMATWGTEQLLSLDAMGVQVAWIESIDAAGFASHPEVFMRQLFPSDEAYERQMTNVDLPLEGIRVGEYLSRDLPFSQREANFDDVHGFLEQDWIVRLEVNGKVLADQPGYGPHSVIVSGYEDGRYILQNPDSAYGQKPDQYVSPELLEKAWQEFGGSKSLNAYGAPEV